MFIKVNAIRTGLMLVRKEDIDTITILRLNGREDGRVVGSTIRFKSGAYLEVQDSIDELLLLLS